MKFPLPCWLPAVVFSLSHAFCPLLHAEPAAGTPIKVGCVGDSITSGVGAPKGYSYPSQLQQMLGPGYQVVNLGNSGSTLLRAGGKPFYKQSQFAGALACKADIYVLMLGANDSKPANWSAHQQEFAGDYRWMLDQLRQANPAAKLYVCKLTPAPDPGNFGINEPTLLEETKIIDSIAADEHLPEIDMHAALAAYPQDLPDHVHPNAEGAARLAKAVYEAITGKAYAGELPLSLPSISPPPAK